MTPFTLRQRVHRQLALASWFAHAYPWRSIVTVLCLLAAGVLEGIGIAAMLPLIRVVLTPEVGAETGIGQVVEEGFRSLHVEPTIGALLAFIVVALCTKSLLTFAAFTQAGFAAATATRDMRMELIRALMHVRWEYFGSERTGNFAAAVSAETLRSANAYLQVCQMVAGLIQVAVYFVLAFLVSWWATLAAVVVGMITVVAMSRFVAMARRSGIEQNLLMRSLSSRLIDGINTMKAIKAMGQERRLLPLLESEIEGLNEAQRRAILSTQGLRTLQEPVLVIALASGLYVLLGIWPGRLEMLFAISFLFFRTVMRVNVVQRSYQSVVQNEPAFWFVRTLTAEAAAAREERSGTRKPEFRKVLRFRSVSFAYDQHLVLEDTDLEVLAGGFTTITGASGSGKTTTLDLVIGLLSPTSGDILVDDVPLREIDLEEWRHMIGYVPQETILFHDSVLTNVTLGDPDISRHEAEEALRRAEAWDFVSHLPAGLDTLVGERGMKLSGGQRQRIAVARALVRRPRLLILDEATAALDPETEAGICRTLHNLSGSVTVLAISHQPALVEAAERVYVLSDSRAEPVEQQPRATVPATGSR